MSLVGDVFVNSNNADENQINAISIVAVYFLQLVASIRNCFPSRSPRFGYLYQLSIATVKTIVC